MPLSPVPKEVQEQRGRQLLIARKRNQVEESEAREMAPESAEHGIIMQEFADDREDIDQIFKEKKMKAIVDKDLCIACGICEGIPEVFSLQREPYLKFCWIPFLLSWKKQWKRPKRSAPKAPSPSKHKFPDK